MMLKVHIWPEFRGEDTGDGGIRRVVEAQRRWLPEVGVEVVDAQQSDLIACHMMAPETYFFHYQDRPFVAHNHGLYWAEYEWYGWALKANRDCMELIRRAEAITAPSQWVTDVLRRHTMRDVVPIRHGIDLSEWEPAENWGYVLWNKNRPDAICNEKIVNMLALQMPKAKFVTTFGKPADNVKVSGRLPYFDAKEVLRHAGVLLCTVRETFGIGTLEAMAAGVPVVGWAWGGQREIIEHGVTGWLVPPGDYDGLKEGIAWATANRPTIAADARAMVEQKYQWLQVAESYAELYRRVVAGQQEKRPKVSVIVTAYKLEQYLRECLDSVQSQSLADWECIVVDDASPDRCGQIADEYVQHDPRFQVIHNEKNEYLAGARNTGIAASHGQYILPLDADDMLPSTALEALAGTLDRDRSIHVAYGNVEFLEPNGERWHSGWPMHFRHDWQLRERNLLPYSSMYRRQVWEATRGYRTRCRTAEDADFWCRASSYGFRPSMVTTNDTLIYRNREGSMSRDAPASQWAAWFPWSQDDSLTPAGAVTANQMPVPSLEPIQISVVIPVGPEHESLVMDAIDSVDAQTFRQWECIVVNDTGHPLTVRLPSWVKVLDVAPLTAMPSQRGRLTCEPRGVAFARNLGIRHSIAPAFVLLDADDYLQPLALASFWQVWEQAGGVVYSDWWEEFEDGTTKLFQPPDYDAHLLTSHGCIHSITALYPKVAWEKVGGFDESLESWEDWDFQLLLADKGICGSRIPAALWTYRKHTGYRREEHYQKFEQSKAAIYRKWSRLWEGGTTLMACGGCPGGGGSVVRGQGTSPPISRRSSAVPDDVLVVEYIGPSQGGRTHRGQVSGTSYYFDGTSSGRIKYVKREDVESFVDRPDFRITEAPTAAVTGTQRDGGSPTPELLVAGPPSRG